MVKGGKYKPPMFQQTALEELDDSERPKGEAILNFEFAAFRTTQICSNKNRLQNW